MSNESTQEFLYRLSGWGVHLTAEGEHLRFSAPPGAMTPAVRTEIARNKPHILRYLRDVAENQQGSPESAGSATRNHAAAPSIENEAISVVPRSNDLPLAHAELRLWLLHQRLPQPSAYNIAWAARVHGPLDRQRLETAVAALMDRHEILRTSYEGRDGHPRRVIADPRACATPFVFEQLTAGGETGIEEALRDRLDGELRKPFDLAAAPLFRVLVLSLAPREHALLIVVHHIIFDEWSMRQFQDELAALYESNGDPATAGLPPLPLQYADYAAWQSRCVAGPDMARHRDYWRKQLEGAPLAIDLPFDRAQTAAFSGAGAVCRFSFERALAGPLEDIGRRDGATPFVIWLAAFAALLSRLSGQDDLVIATPFAHRQRPEAQRMIGFFLNTLPLRLRVDGAAGFSALVRSVRTAALDGFEHGELPLDEIVTESARDRSSMLPGFFPVMFVLQHDAVDSFVFPGTTTEPLPVRQGTAKALLTLFLRRGSDGSFSGSIEFSAGAFTEATITRIIAQFRQLLESFVHEPDAPIASAGLLPPEQRRQLLEKFNPPVVAYPRESTVDALFARQAALTPRATALICDTQRLSYGELALRAQRLGGHLRRLGVKRGALVAVHLDRSIEFVVTVLAVLESGAAYVPLDTTAPGERLRFILEDTRASVVVCRGPLPTGFEALEAVVVDLARDARAIAESECAEARAAHGPDEPAYVMYTSGSTGRPKGVVVPHRGIVRLVRGQTYAAFEPGERFLLLASTAFDASTFELWGPLLNGATCVIHPEHWPELDRLERVVRKHKVTCLWLTAGLFNHIVDDRPWVLAGVRRVLTGGEVMSPPHCRRALEALPSLRLTNGYGPTECTTFATTFAIPDDPADCPEPVPIGRPIAHTRCYILDPHGNPCPIGVRGELYLGGDGVALGYLNRPELTAGSFVPDPFSGDASARLYRTGDQARWLADGTIEFLGRLDGQIKLRGFRIELGEIESVLAQHSDLVQAVVALREVDGNKELHAGLVPRAGATLSVEEIRKWLSPRLPDYMIPARYAVLDRLPLNANGKVDRQALLAVEHRELAREAEHVAPRTDVEVALTAIWQRVLGRERIGIRDNFFDVGGTSLLAMRLAHEVRREFNRPLPLAGLFAAPTIERLALRLERGGSGEQAVGAKALRGSGSGTPLFHMPGLGGFGFLPPVVVRRIESERQFFDGLQHRGIDGHEKPLDRVEAIAANLIAQIREVCPAGPYSLTGYCYGGVVAYEVARQLTAAGERVKGVVMWDSFPARCWRWRGPTGILCALRRHPAGSTPAERFAFVRQQAGRLLRTSKRMAKRALGRRDLPGPAAREGLSPGIREAIIADYRALGDYKPRPYAGRVLLLRSKEDERERIAHERRPLNGWDGLLLGHVDVVDFPCKHQEILEEPVASEAAERMAAFLREADES